MKKSVDNLLKALLGANAGSALEARVHNAFTQAADWLFGLGYITRDERLALSAAIGQSLTELAAAIEVLGLRERMIETWHAEQISQVTKAALGGKLRKFAQLSKVDEATHEVWGIAAEEVPDSTGEIMDYAASKPNFKAWSDRIFKASGGKSRGNVRAMHRAVAAGKLVYMDLRDAEKTVYIGAEIVDETEWQKVLKGVYTGFSIGGDYGKTWKDPQTGLLRYEAIPVEISLADNPAMHGATFEIVKATGVETRTFVGMGKAAYPWDQCMRDQTERYGSEETARKVCGMIRHKYGGKAVQAGALGKQEGESMEPEEDTSDIEYDGVLEEILAAIETELGIVARQLQEQAQEGETQGEATPAEQGEAAPQPEPTAGAAPAEQAAGPEEQAAGPETRAGAETQPEIEIAGLTEVIVGMVREQLAALLPDAVMQILVGLGLIEMVNGTPHVALGFARSEEVRGVRKDMARIPGREELAKVVGDVAQIVVAVESLGERIEAVADLAKQGGPVLRDLGPITPAALGGQGEDVLKALLAEVTDPQAKQIIGQKLAELQIRAVQSQPGIRVR